MLSTANRNLVLLAAATFSFLGTAGCATSLERSLSDEHDRLLLQMDREADQADQAGRDRAEDARLARSKPGRTTRPGQGTRARPQDRETVSTGADGPAGLRTADASPRAAGNELTSLLDQASRRSPALRALLADWKAALARIPQSRSLPEPVLGYGFYARSVETRVGPQRHRLSLSQKIPWIGKLTSKTKVELRKAQVARAAYFAALNRLFFEIKVAYYELYYLEKRREILAEHTKILASLETILRARMAVDLTAQSQVVKLQVETAKTADLVRSSEERIQAAEARINGLARRNPATAVAIPRRLDSLPTSLPSARRLAALARRSNPEMALAADRIKLTHAVVRAAKTSSLPDFTLSLTYIETGRTDMDVPDRGKDAVILGVAVTLPVWVNKYRGQVAEARARVKAARARRDDLAARLDAAVFAAMARYRDALRRRSLYRRGLIVKAEQSLRTALQSYAVGKAGFLDVLDAERTLLAFALEAERAAADLAKALAALELALGRPYRAWGQKNESRHATPNSGPTRKHSHPSQPRGNRGGNTAVPRSAARKSHE